MKISLLSPMVILERFDGMEIQYPEYQSLPELQFHSEVSEMLAEGNYTRFDDARINLDMLAASCRINAMFVHNARKDTGRPLSLDGHSVYIGLAAPKTNDGNWAPHAWIARPAKDGAPADVIETCNDPEKLGGIKYVGFDWFAIDDSKYPIMAEARRRFDERSKRHAEVRKYRDMIAGLDLSAATPAPKAAAPKRSLLGALLDRFRNDQKS